MNAPKGSKDSDSYVGQLKAAYPDCQPEEIRRTALKNVTSKSVTGQGVIEQSTMEQIEHIVSAEKFSDRTLFIMEETAANSEASYLISAETTSDAIVIMDESFCILYANNSAATLFGYPREELVAQNLTVLMPDFLHYAHEIGAARDLSTQKRKHTQVLETSGLTRSGRSFPVEVSFGEHYEQDNRRLTAIMRDASEHERIAAALTEARQALEARVEERTFELERTKAELEQANARLFYGAFHDKLTGLANRTLFLDRLRLMLERDRHRTDQGFAVMYLDCDRFKVVNDSFGHDTGDQLLVELGGRLKGCMRPTDLVARLGGDEFAILLDTPVTSEHAVHCALRIRHEIAKPFVIGAQTVYMSLSTGIAMSQVSSGSAAEIVRDADIAMHHAKTLGRARYQLFTGAMRQEALGLSTLEIDLQGSKTHREMEVYYQPIISLEKGHLVGFEALLRWHHPTLGLLTPAEFISVAEETEMIIELDRWVLRQACAQLKRWQQLVLPFPLTLNVNLSSKQFARSDLVPLVTQVLLDTEVAAEQLSLEITESVFMHEDDKVNQIVQQLRTLGVSICVDDFGTGYSSLSYLQRFLVDSLKIDTSFVSDVATSVKSSELIKTILTMAQALGLRVIAEGIETKAQRDHLTNSGCVFGQGYAFAKPLPEKEATLLLTLGTVQF